MKIRKLEFFNIIGKLALVLLASLNAVAEFIYIYIYMQSPPSKELNKVLLLESSVPVILRIMNKLSVETKAS